MTRAEDRARRDGWPTITQGAETALIRARGRCERCGQDAGIGMSLRLVVHHVGGRGFPAQHHPALLAVLHDRCHRIVHDFPASAYEQGWMLRRNGVDRDRAVAYLAEQRDRTERLTVADLEAA